MENEGLLSTAPAPGGRTEVGLVNYDVNYCFHYNFVSEELLPKMLSLLFANFKFWVCLSIILNPALITSPFPVRRGGQWKDIVYSRKASKKQLLLGCF
jgi:hypothetical protein